MPGSSVTGEVQVTVKTFKKWLLRLNYVTKVVPQSNKKLQGASWVAVQ